MNKTEQSSQVWPYQVKLLAAVIKWSLITFGLGFLANSLWLWWDPLWRTLIQNGAVMLMFLSNWVSLHLIRQGQAQRAARLFMATSFGMTGLALLTLGEPFILNGLSLLLMITLIGMFILPPPEALKWGGGGLLLYIAALTARYSLLGYERAGPELVGLFLFGGLILGAFLLLGRSIAGQLNAALAQSDAVRQNLEERALQLEQTTAALQASEEKYRTMFAVNPDFTYLTDVEGNFLEVNPALLKQVGLPLATMRQMNVRDFFPAADTTQLFQAMAKLQQGEAITGLEIQAKGPHPGEVRDYQINAIPLHEDGKIVKVLSLARDITARKQMEAALRASEEKYRAYVDNAPDGIMVIDSAGRYLETNDAACRILGYNREEILKMSIQDILPPEAQPTALNRFAELLATGRSSGEYELTTGSGERRFVTVEAVKIGDNSYLGFHKDTTGRRRLEDTLRQESRFRQIIIENAVEGLSVCSAIETYPFVAFSVWNERMTDLTGYTMAEINRLGWYQTMYPEPELRQLAIERMERMRHGDNLAGEEWPVTCKNGQQRLLSISTARLTLDDGSGHVLGLMRDLTEQRRMEKLLRDANARLEHILSTSPSTIYTIDLLNHQLTFISDNVKPLLGYEPRQFMGDDNFWLAHIHPEELELCRSSFTRLLAEGQNAMDYRFQHEAGAYLWMHDAARVIYDDQNQPQEIVGAWSDLTTQMEAAEAQRRYVERLKILHQIDQSILANQPPVALTQTALRHSSCLIPYQSGVVILFDAETAEGVIFTSFASRDDAPVLPAGARLPLATFKGLSDYSQQTSPQQPYIIDDILTVPAAARLADILQRQGIRSVMVAHLRVREQMIGVVSFGAAASGVFTPDHLEIAQEVAYSLAVAIQHSRLQQERQQHQTQLEASLREKEAMLKEIHHRVKNNLQVISSLLTLQAGRTEDAVALNILRDSRTRIRSMALIHEKLYQSKDLARIDLAQYIHSLASYLFKVYQIGAGQIVLKVEVANISLDVNMAMPCGLILNELISNALKHAFPSGQTGEIRVKLHAGDNRGVALIVADNGIGFPANVDFRQTTSLGLQLVNTLVEQLDGTIALNQDTGTEFIISFAY